jgi:hypothetical protein
MRKRAVKGRLRPGDPAPYAARWADAPSPTPPPGLWTGAPLTSSAVETRRLGMAGLSAPPVAVPEGRRTGSVAGAPPGDPRRRFGDGRRGSLLNGFGGGLQQSRRHAGERGRIVVFRPTTIVRRVLEITGMVGVIAIDDHPPSPDHLD